MWRALPIPLSVIIVVGMAGCAAPVRPEEPAEVYRHYRALVAQARYDEARRLLSPAARARLDAGALAALPAAPPVDGAADITATLPGRDDVLLRLIDRHWLVDRDQEAPYRQDEPLAALRSFARAVRDHRYDVVYRFVPPTLRARTSAAELRAAWEGNGSDALVRELTALEAALPSAAAAIADHRATVRWADHNAKLVETGGVWTVERLH